MAERIIQHQAANTKCLQLHGHAARQVSHTRDIGLTTYSSLDSQIPDKSGLPVFKGLTRQLSAETSNVTGILEQLNAALPLVGSTNENFMG